MDATAAELATRIRAVVRLISPEHITPVGARQIEAAIRDTLGEDPEGLMEEW